MFQPKFVANPHVVKHHVRMDTTDYWYSVMFEYKDEDNYRILMSVTTSEKVAVKLYPSVDKSTVSHKAKPSNSREEKTAEFIRHIDEARHYFEEECSDTRLSIALLKNN